MKKLIYLAIFIFLAVAVASCDKNEGAYYPVPSDFSVSPATAQSVPVTGAQIELTISAGNLGWWVETSETWCTVSRKYGSGDNKITLTINQNTTGAARQCIVTVSPTFKKESVDITINQQ